MLPRFTPEGVLPQGDHTLTIEGLRLSFLVTGEGVASGNWDTSWRMVLVDNLDVLVEQLWGAGIDRIFVDGSFVEAKDHPNDIDGYFECTADFLMSGRLQTALDAVDSEKIWDWSAASRIWDPATQKRQLKMWHRYRVELFPHVPGPGCGIVDRYGNEVEFPAAFRTSRAFRPKGIVQIVRQL